MVVVWFGLVFTLEQLFDFADLDILKIIDQLFYRMSPRLHLSEMSSFLNVGCRESGREGDARGRRYGDICICISDSLCYKAEINTAL